MKILVWTDGFWPRLGGVETHGVELIHGLHKRGHQCRVVAQKDHPDWQNEEIYEGIPIQRFDFNAVLFKRDLTKMREIQEHIEKILKEFEPDIIHLNVGLGGSAFLFLSVLKMFRAPVVFTAHAPYLYEQKIPPVIQKIAVFAKRICCVSDWVLKEMERHLPECRGKLQRIYNGLPLPKGDPASLSFTPPTFLLFGRLVKEKGFAHAIDAFSLLKKEGSDARLVIGGGGLERKVLEKQVDVLGLREWTEFTGVLTPEEVVAVFNKATCVIVPSLIESFGLVILEAMQMGRPVIASCVEGIPEVVSDGRTGFLVPPQDPKALCLAMQTILKYPEKAMQMGLEGVQRSKMFSIDRTVDQFEAVYKAVL